MAAASSHDLIPAAPNRRVRDAFIWYSRRLARKKFHALRLEPASVDVLSALAADPRPVLIAVNHSSWWDPIIGVLVGARFYRNRTHLAPMDSVQLRRFGFFRRLGLFGIDPDSPQSMQAMLEYVLERFRLDHAPTLWITPQGEFTDVREPIRIRPGLAALAARAGAAGNGVRMISLAIEYAFWQDARPEVFLRARNVAGPARQDHSTAAWQRAITDTMQSNADALSVLVKARDPAAFVNLNAREAHNGAKVHPVYDLYLRATGRSGRLTTGAERKGSPSEISLRQRRREKCESGVQPLEREGGRFASDDLKPSGEGPP